MTILGPRSLASAGRQRTMPRRTNRPTARISSARLCSTSRSLPFAPTRPYREHALIPTCSDRPAGPPSSHRIATLASASPPHRSTQPHALPSRRRWNRVRPHRVRLVALGNDRMLFPWDRSCVGAVRTSESVPSPHPGAARCHRSAPHSASRQSGHRSLTPGSFSEPSRQSSSGSEESSRSVAERAAMFR